MPSVYQLKPAFQSLLRPLARTLFNVGVTANQVTVFAAVVSILIGVAISYSTDRPWVIALVAPWMLIRMALNAIDGMLAREFGQQSHLGAYLNELGDAVADIALVLSFATLAGVNLWLLILVALLTLISEYAGVLGPMVGASRRYDGPMGKSDRALALGGLALGIAFGWLSAFWINAAFAGTCILLFCTITNRIRQGVEQAKPLAA